MDDRIKRTVTGYVTSVGNTLDLSRIDACDADLATIVAASRKHRNSLLPVMKLPADIHDRIINALYIEVLNGLTTRSRSAQAKAMHDFGATCMQFRLYLLSSSAPWGLLPFPGMPEWTKTYIRCTPPNKPIELCVKNVFYGPKISVQDVEDLLDRAGRPIIALSVDVDEEEASPGALLLKGLSTHYNALTSLRTLSVEFFSPFPTAQSTSPALRAFQHALKAQCFPVIENLTISGRWGLALSELPQMVRRLELGNPLELLRHPGAATAALGALKHLKELTLRMELDYVDMGLELSTAPSRESRPRFENLQTLAIHAPWHIVFLFFEWSHIVPWCDVEIDAFKLQDGPEEIAKSGLAALCAYWDSHGVKAFKEISILPSSTGWTQRYGQDVLRAAAEACDPGDPSASRVLLAIFVDNLTTSSGDAKVLQDMLSAHRVVQDTSRLSLDGRIFACGDRPNPLFTHAKTVVMNVQYPGAGAGLDAIGGILDKYPNLRVLEVDGLCIELAQAKVDDAPPPPNGMLDGLLHMQDALRKLSPWVELRFTRCALCDRTTALVRERAEQTRVPVVLANIRGIRTFRRAGTNSLVSQGGDAVQ